MLGSLQDLERDRTRTFLLSECQASRGGFKKTPDAYPDILHTFYSICWLSMDQQLSREEQVSESTSVYQTLAALGIETEAVLRPIDPKLGICV